MKAFSNQNEYGLAMKVTFVVFITLYGLVKYMPGPIIGDFLRYLVLKIFAEKLQSWRISDGVTFWYPWRISIGRHVQIGEFCFLDGYGGLTIGDWTLIAHGCSILSEDHAFDHPDMPIHFQLKKSAAVAIGRDVWLGCGVKVLRGVTIGDGAVIGAGSVVTRDIPPNAVAVGAPAKIIRFRDKREV